MVAYRTHVHDLDNDSLLQIFTCYQLEEEHNWNHRFTWQRLAHVCRRWRHLIFDSCTHLDMSLHITNDSPSIDTLSHLSPLPLVINFPDGTRTMERKDEDNIHFGLQQHGRVRQVILQAPSSSLRMWLEPMNKLYPRLRDLSLLSTTTEEMSLLLPETLQVPFLRLLSLHGIGLPKGLQSLSSMVALSTLFLTHIQEACYFPPRHLVTQLQNLYHLEELSIGFAIPIPLPSNERELLPAPIPPVTLPTLRRLTFVGVDIYLDNLVAQINTPLLERLSVTLFFDLVFTLVNLTEFIHRTEGFGCLIARVIFSKDGATIYYEQRSIDTLSLHINCAPLDWQMDSATQACIALGDIVSAVEDLTLDLDVGGMPSDSQNTLDSMMWHELLLPFICVKKLHIGSSLTLELSQALESVPGRLVLELVPELQELEVHLGNDQEKNAFSAFVKTRESVGRPVYLILRIDQANNLRSILDEAAVQYKELTEYNLATHPLAARFDNWDSADTILEVFQDQARKFNEFRKGNEKLMEWLKPTVQILVSISASFGNAATSVQLVFTGISILLSVSLFLNSLSSVLYCTPNLDPGRGGCCRKLRSTCQPIRERSIFPTTSQDLYWYPTHNRIDPNIGEDNGRDNSHPGTRNKGVDARIDQ